MKNKIIFFVFMLVGGVTGLFIVREYFLNPMQIAGWKMFWGSLPDAGIIDIKTALSSKTFLKSALGFTAGAVIGGYGGTSIYFNIKNRRKKNNEL